ncbi:DUF883 family protein [Neisseria sp. Ec49-e6-T10]|uniref:DUF883 family protein n=1 Tax=Neisseria sp. Ec49-e6-T10 TaxID=3140744 RepID=UPI003EBC45F2
MAKNVAEQSEKLLSEVREVLNNAEQLVDAAAEKGNEEAHVFKERLLQRLKETKAHLHEVEHDVVARAKCAAKATDGYVHDNPYKAIGVAAAIAFLLGLLISRR